MKTDIKIILPGDKPLNIDLSQEDLNWELEEIDEREMGVERLYEAVLESDGGTDTVLKTKLFGLKVRHFNNSCLLIAFTRSIHALFSM
jgi:hypothetical protein